MGDNEVLYLTYYFIMFINLVSTLKTNKKKDLFYLVTVGVLVVDKLEI